MEERNELKVMMEEVINQVSKDSETGIIRFLQANPYSSFEYYNFNVLKNKSDLFEKTLYCESKQSKIYKEYICNILENPNGKNTFFLVGYQGCGKSTFIHSVINMYIKEVSSSVIIIDCDKKGKDANHLKNIISNILIKTIKNSIKIKNFVEFFRDNYDAIDELNDDNFEQFYSIIKNFDDNNYSFDERKNFYDIKQFINEKLSTKESFYLLVLWNLAINYDCIEKSQEKLILFIDNLDCVDEYYELSDFISCIDSLTVDFSEIFEKINLCNSMQINETFVSKIKIFITMRETTKANLPHSHFSDAFRSIYTNKDMTEWYDKGEIARNRISKLLEYDEKGKLNSTQRTQLQLFLKIADDIYTKNVFYPLFNNNYRSAVDMIVSVVINYTEHIKTFSRLMDYNKPKYKHGARGILFKHIFDELNKGDGNQESCLKRIGVLDLLNRKNNSVSICRLILSYLSNYTETKCDSGRNSIPLKEIIDVFKEIFSCDEIDKILYEMFALRDSKWSHLISFNQIEYSGAEHKIDSNIDIRFLVPNRTMLHYSCAGKIYIEYVATHFEFFTTRIFKERKDALFCDSNLEIDAATNNYICYDIIKKVFSEVERCCIALKKFNNKLCELNNYPDPYVTPNIYIESHYVCMFKRIEYDGKERRFKQFHEERIILTHINYIDCYRLYVLNDCNKIKYEEKIVLNKKLTECIKNYVALLESKNVLKNEYTYQEFIEHYNNQIEKLEKDWTNFDIEISKNS